MITGRGGKSSLQPFVNDARHETSILREKSLIAAPRRFASSLSPSLPPNATGDFTAACGGEKKPGTLIREFNAIHFRPLCVLSWSETGDRFE